MIYVDRWAAVKLAKIPELDELVVLLRADVDRHAPEPPRLQVVPFYLLDETPTPVAWLTYSRYGHR